MSNNFKYLIEVHEWVNCESNVQELHFINGCSVDDQIKKLNEQKLGVGILFYMVDSSGLLSDKVQIELEVKSKPMVMLHDSWYVIIHNNISDIFMSVLQMIVVKEENVQDQ